MRRILLAALVVGAPAPAGAQLPADFAAAWAATVAEHRQGLDSEGIVGASLAFVDDGDVVAADYWGMEDLGSDRAVDEHTIYHWASITKTFTAVGVMTAPRPRPARAR